MYYALGEVVNQLHIYYPIRWLGHENNFFGKLNLEKEKKHAIHKER